MNETDLNAAVAGEAKVQFEPRAELGRFEVRGPQRWVAGEYTSMELVYIVGEAGLARGSCVRLSPPNTTWTQPLVPFVRYWEHFEAGDHRHYVPFKRVNTTATVAGVAGASGARIHLDAEERMMGPDMPADVGFWRWWIIATVEGADLLPGEEICVLYGNTDHGEEPVQIQRWPGEVCFAAFVKPADEPTFYQVENSPLDVRVEAGGAAKLHLIVPSVVRPGEAFGAKAGITDAYDCIPGSVEPGTKVTVVGEGVEAEEGHLAGHAGRVEPVRVGREGRVRVRAVDDHGREAEANPALCRSQGLGLFWGDLHAQTRFHVFNDRSSPYFDSGRSSISSGEPEEVFAYARDVSGLDFVAITDQGGIFSPGWEVTQQLVREMYEPGRFVPMKGYEAGTLVGHRNVIFRGDEIEPVEDPERFSLEPRALYEHYRGRRDVMIIPHHVKIWTDWDYHDPELEPLLEIYSTWGSSEAPGVEPLWDKGMTPGASAQAAWARGYRLGTIGSSDTHVGMPGRSVFLGDRQATCQSFGGGLAAVWCDELSRESVFDALRARRCYGTSGARILVEWFLNEQPMGSEVSLAGAEAGRHFTGQVLGTAEIACVEILRDNQPVQAFFPEGRDTFILDWQDEARLAGPCFYYLRVTQRDGHRAWTSPIWVEPGQAGA